MICKAILTFSRSGDPIPHLFEIWGTQISDVGHQTSDLAGSVILAANAACGRSGTVNDPNWEDDPEYIVRLVGQVVTVSVETVRLVKELAGLSIDRV